MAEEEVPDFESIPYELPLAGTFVGLACLMALYQIYVHVTHYRAPALQRPIIRILLMVPIYGICSFFSLMFKNMALYIDVARDTYEAFILYQFMSLLVEYCGGERELVRVLNCKKSRAKHLAPFCCFGFAVDKDFLMLCKRGTLQYCIIKPITAMLAVLCHIFGVYHDGVLDFGAADAFPTIFVINNLCVGVSMYYLVLFGTALQDELKIHKPMMKFMCIKCIIFFSFWQGATLTLLVRLGWIIHDRYEYHEAEFGTMSPSPPPTISASQVQSALQDFLICCEMLGISIMHHWAFTYQVLQKEASQSRYAYLFTQGARAKKVNSTQQQLEAVVNIGEAVNLVDCIQDGKRTFAKAKAGLLEDDTNYERAFATSDRKVDHRTGLPIVDLDPAEVAHFPFFFRDDRTTFYWFGTVKRATSKGKQVPCVLAISDTALYVLTPHGEPKRCVPLENIEEIVTEVEEGRVSFRILKEHDLQLYPDNAGSVTDITHILTQWFKVFGEGRELKVEFFGGVELNLETPRGFEVNVLEPACPMDSRTNLPLAHVPAHLRPLCASLGVEGSVLYFFEKVLRIKPHMHSQRILAITDASIYILKLEGEVRRCIPIGDIDEVLVDPINAEVGFIVRGDCDLLVQCSRLERADEIVTILQAWFRYFCEGCSTELRVSTVSKQNQRKLVLRNKENHKHQAIWYMGHRKGKDKSRTHGVKEVSFGVSLDELARQVPAGEFRWEAAAKNQSFVKDTSSRCSDDDLTWKGGVRVNVEDTTEATECHLRDDESDRSSDAGSSCAPDEPAVQLGYASLPKPAEGTAPGPTIHRTSSLDNPLTRVPSNSFPRRSLQPLPLDRISPPKVSYDGKATSSSTLASQSAPSVSEAETMRSPVKVQGVAPTQDTTEVVLNVTESMAEDMAEKGMTIEKVEEEDREVFHDKPETLVRIQTPVNEEVFGPLVDEEILSDPDMEVVSPESGLMTKVQKKDSMASFLEDEHWPVLPDPIIPQQKCSPTTNGDQGEQYPSHAPEAANITPRLTSSPLPETVMPDVQGNRVAMANHQSSAPTEDRILDSETKLHRSNSLQRPLVPLSPALPTVPQLLLRNGVLRGFATQSSPELASLAIPGPPKAAKHSGNTEPCS